MADGNAPSQGLGKVVSTVFNANMSDHVRAFLIIFMFGNLLWMISAAASIFPNWVGFLRVMGTSGLLSGAALICGGLIGFVFGIPRILTSATNSVVVTPLRQPNQLIQPNQAIVLNQDPAPQQPLPAAQNASLRASSSVAPNTNLEQISDWLTKVLVGIGLTQIEKIGSLLSQVSGKLAPSLDPLPNGGIVAVSIIAAFGVAGFSWAYFESRTSFMKVFDAE